MSLVVDDEAVRSEDPRDLDRRRGALDPDRRRGRRRDRSGDLADAIQQGVKAWRSGDGDGATRLFGHTVQLAAKAGDVARLEQLAGFVAIDDPATGRVRIRPDASNVAAMIIDHTLDDEDGPPSAGARARPRRDHPVPRGARVVGFGLLRRQYGAPMAVREQSHRDDTTLGDGRRPLPTLWARPHAGRCLLRGVRLDLSSEVPTTTRWVATIAADRDYHERLELTGFTFPEGAPTRRVVLDRDELLIGRSTADGDQTPDIDLADKPEDPAASRTTRGWCVAPTTATRSSTTGRRTARS